jgi:hypothetical protein
LLYLLSSCSIACLSFACISLINFWYLASSSSILALFAAYKSMICLLCESSVYFKSVACYVSYCLIWSACWASNFFIFSANYACYCFIVSACLLCNSAILLLYTLSSFYM